MNLITQSQATDHSPAIAHLAHYLLPLGLVAQDLQLHVILLIQPQASLSRLPSRTHWQTAEWPAHVEILASNGRMLFFLGPNKPVLNERCVVFFDEIVDVDIGGEPIWVFYFPQLLPAKILSHELNHRQLLVWILGLAGLQVLLAKYLIVIRHSYWGLSELEVLIPLLELRLVLGIQFRFLLLQLNLFVQILDFE